MNHCFADLSKASVVMYKFSSIPSLGRCIELEVTGENITSPKLLRFYYFAKFAF